MTESVQGYLFDLQGYLVLEGAIVEADLLEMNQWIDDHWSFVESPWLTDEHSEQRSRWIGHVETQTYNKENGVNFQNIIEGGAVFERLIDYPSWIALCRKYINPTNSALAIHENFLTLRAPGEYIHLHGGGHAPKSHMTFRQNNTGEWMVGMINVLVALNDIGAGDGPPVLIPGSHKCTEVHPRLAKNGKKLIYDSVSGEAAGTAVAVKQMYLKAGDVLFFTDGITHGAAERTNPGYRRTAIYRYCPRHFRERFNYQLSEELLGRLTPDRRKIVQPTVPRRPPQADELA